MSDVMNIAPSPRGTIAAAVIKASRQTAGIRSASLAKNLTDSFRRSFASAEDNGVKGKRDPAKNSTGRIEPRGTGKTHKKFSKSQPDGSSSRTKIGRMLIEAALSITAAMLFVARDLDSGTSTMSFVRDGSVAKRLEAIVGKLLAEQHREQLVVVESKAG